jgi:hypothetical protein
MAAERALLVRIVGSSAGLEAAFAKSGASAEGFGKKMQAVGARTAAVGKSMTMGITLPIIGIGVVAVKAALEAEKSTARLDTAFKAVGLSAGKYATEIMRTEEAGRKLGFTNTEIKQGLGSLIIATKDVGKAHRDLGIAEDLARFKGISLADATKMMTMAMTGSQRAVKQLGIIVGPVTTAVDKLKAAHVSTKTAAGALEYAHAKLLDKMLTGNAIIDAVSAKVKGQGAAFAATASGGMAVFRAQLNNLLENLGKTFIPMLNKVVGWLSQAMQWFEKLSPSTKKWIEIIAGAAAVIGPVLIVVGSLTSALAALIPVVAALASPIGLLAAGIALLGGAMLAAQFAPKQFQAVLERLGLSAQQAKTVVDDLRSAFQVFKTIVTAVFQTLGPVVAAFFGILKAQFQLISDLVTGKWGKIWGDLKRIFVAQWNLVKAEFNAVVGVLSGIMGKLWSAVTSIAGKIGRGIVDDIVKPIVALPGKAWGELKKLIGALQRLGVDAWNEAVKIGKAIVQGAIAGFTSLVGGMVNTVVGGFKSALSSVGSILGIGSPSKKFHTIGVQMAQGVIEGWFAGIAPLMGRMNASLSRAIAGARATVRVVGASFTAAWRTLGQDAMLAFDAATKTGLDRIQTNLDAKLAGISQRLTAGMAQLNRILGLQTAAANAPVTALQAQMQAQQDAKSLADAQLALQQALATGDAKQIADAQYQLTQVQEQIQLQQLQAQAIKDTTAARAEYNKEAAKLKTEAKKETTAAREAAKDEKAAWTERRKVQKVELRQYLAELERELKANPKLWAKNHAEIMAKFKNVFGPDFTKWGKNLGQAFATGLRNSFGDITKALKELAQLCADLLKLKSPAKTGPLSDLNKWWTSFSATLLTGLDTAAIQRAVVGAVTPPGLSGGGRLALAGGGRVLHTGGYAGSSQPIQVNLHLDGKQLASVLVDPIGRELNRHLRRNAA